MTTLKICTIHDSKVGAYMRPMTFTALGQAERTFRDIVNDLEHEIGKHPEDYTLFMVGEFNDQTGNIEAIEPLSIGNGINYKEPEIT